MFCLCYDHKRSAVASVIGRPWHRTTAMNSPPIKNNIYHAAFLSGLAWSLRAEEGQGQQGHHRVEHHVHRGTVPEVPASALEVPEDGGQQAVRVHARNP